MTTEEFERLVGFVREACDMNAVGTGVAVAVIGGLVTSILLQPMLGALVRWLGSRSVHRFWRPLIDESVAIVWSEYSNESLSGSDPMIALVRNLGITHFISKGNALANASISQFLSRDLHFHNFKTHGDKTHEDDSNKNLILIGSPATNNYSNVIFKNMRSSFDMSFDIVHDHSTISIMDLESKKSYEAKIDEKNCGVDYALVIRAHTTNSRRRCCLLLCGASMWGVEGAAKVVTSPKMLRKVSRLLAISGDIGFLIKVDVINNMAQNPEIVRVGKGPHKYVRPLRKSRSP